ncbi:MAG: glycosyltransferase family 9 protein [Ignavibacteriaceae bacterium]
MNILLSFRYASNPEKVDYQNANSKILFIRLNRIGDALVVTPLIHEIRHAVKSKIFLLADRKNYFVFENNKDIDKVITFEKGIRGIIAVLKFIKDNKINTVVDLHDDISTTVTFLIAFSKASNKFGLEKENKKIYTKTVPKLNPINYHVVDRILELCKLFTNNGKKEDLNIRYSVQKSAEVNVSKFIQNNELDGNFLVGVNISAGSSARFWGIDNYKKLFSLLSTFKLKYVLLTAPEDIKLAEKIAEEKINIYFSKNYNEYAAMISRLNLLFTPDTAAVHLASAFKVPVFGIYVKYKTNDMIWSPYRSKFDCIITEEPNLENVTFNEVRSKFEPFLRNILLEYDKK